jgi:hypothetical protein
MGKTRFATPGGIGMTEWYDDPEKKTRLGCLLMCATFMAGVIAATVLSSLLRRLGS